MDDYFKIKVEGEMDLAQYELESAKILLNANQFRDSVMHSYFAMFSASKSLLYMKNQEITELDELVSIFCEEYVKNGKFDRCLFSYLTDAQFMLKFGIFVHNVYFDKNSAQTEINNAVEFIAEVYTFL